MNNVLKQRLVGALILVALGVVFWPIIFVEPDVQGGLVTSAPPPSPEVDTRPISPPDKVGLRSSPPLADGEEDMSVTAEPNTPSSVAKAQAPVDGQADGDESAPGSEVVEPAPVPERQSDAVASRTRDEAPAQPETDSQGVPVAWIVQVISVSRKDNAEETRSELEALGYKAYIKPAEVGGKTVYRVYVGPKFERAKIEAIKAEVDRRLGVSSMVRRYFP